MNETTHEQARMNETANTRQTDEIKMSHLSKSLGISDDYYLKQLAKLVDGAYQLESDRQYPDTISEPLAVQPAMPIKARIESATMRVMNMPQSIQRKRQQQSYERNNPRNLPPGETEYYNGTLAPWSLAFQACTEHFRLYRVLPKALYLADERLNDILNDTFYATGRSIKHYEFEYPRVGQDAELINIYSDRLLGRKLGMWSILCKNDI
jgi:hypothetical protein